MSFRPYTSTLGRMSVALSSQRALHAVRLVIRDYQIPPKLQRGFSVAVLPNYPSSSRSSPTTTARDDTWNLRHAASDYATNDFLEPSHSPEYTSAALTLPSRPLQTTAHWATLYPSPSASTSTLFTPPVKSRRCDTLAHLASSGNLSVARTVYNELTALHIGIQRRASYLPAALSALSHSDPKTGQADFLFWLELVPNRPAVRSHAGVKAIWDPVVDKLITEYSTDKSFISDFLSLSARKGILPTVLPRLMRHLAHYTPLPELKGLMAELQAVYVAGTTSRRSVSARAEAHAVYAQIRVRDMWDAYVRVLAGAGWVDEAEDILQKGEGWLEYTWEYVESKRANLLSYGTKIPEVTKVIGRLRQAKRTRISPSSLANLITDLGALHRLTLIQRLERRMTSTPNLARRESWYHANILLARRRGLSNQAIVEMFNSHFSWVGIPATNLSLPPTPPTAKIIPSSSIFTTLLPSLIPLLAEPLAFHASYLALTSTLSPRLQPTPVTHSVFLREITHRLGPSAGLEALRNMINAGLEPGLGAFESVLWSMAGRAEWGGVQGLLGGMEQGADIGQGSKMPEPEPRTYRGIVGILERAGLVVEADQIRERAEMREAEVPKPFQRIVVEEVAEPQDKTAETEMSKEGGTVLANVVDVEEKKVDVSEVTAGVEVKPKRPSGGKRITMKIRQQQLARKLEQERAEQVLVDEEVPEKVASYA